MLPLEDCIKFITVISFFAGGFWTLILFVKSQKIQKAQLYKDMEFKAIDLFLTSMKDPELNKIYDEEDVLSVKDMEVLKKDSNYDFAFSILNLFELMYNLQKRRLITEEIFMTWVAWYWEFGKGCYNKKLWIEEARWNYSTDFTKVMDMMFRMDNKTELKKVYEYLDEQGMLRFNLEKWLQAREEVLDGDPIS